MIPPGARNVANLSNRVGCSGLRGLQAHEQVPLAAVLRGEASVGHNRRTLTQNAGLPLRRRQRLLVTEHVLGLADGPQETRLALPEQHLSRRGMAQEAEVTSTVAIRSAVEHADQVPRPRVLEGDVGPEHVERGTTR